METFEFQGSVTNKRTRSSPRNIEWSISDNQKDSLIPVLTSLTCYNALADFFRDDESYTLVVATESSSHISGLDSLFAQPWVYAGGGLGNMDECPTTTTTTTTIRRSNEVKKMQICLAGGTQRDSLTFASVCVVPECTATDLSAEDFPARLQTAAFQAGHESNIKNLDIIREHVTLHHRIAEVNKFLNTGWVCGQYRVQWQILPTTLYLVVVILCVSLSIIGTFFYDNNASSSKAKATSTASTSHQNCKSQSFQKRGVDEKKDTIDALLNSGTNNQGHKQKKRQGKRTIRFLSHWDMNRHLEHLSTQRNHTACLDGLKVGSILWVIFGHTMAIQSSTGSGYLNPWGFLPPTGITTTLLGQLLFSSRFAVDTFLCISGYLTVYVLRGKTSMNPFSIVAMLVYRILRILPLYASCLGFWMFLAPHLGSGPFWYQWEHFLEPCRKYWWTNLLFVNNFWPWATPTTDTCFYHSWYLAVDVQLFILCAPWLVHLYGKSRSIALYTTFTVWFVSVLGTAILSYQNNWSINTFDGRDVALFDIEGYAKPHVRAQSYLSGMFVAMLPWTRPHLVRDMVLVGISVCLLFYLSFVTVTGAYARRPCNFAESPLHSDCGSLWTNTETFFYTAFSRAIWSICVGVLIYSCVHKRGYLVEKILSLKVLTPLAHLSFGAYLIHPIVLFLWQLGGKEKTTFRMSSLLMDFTSVSFVSFVLSAAASLTIEMPLGEILRLLQRKGSQSKILTQDQNTETQLIGQDSAELIPLTEQSFTYGSVHEHHR